MSANYDGWLVLLSCVVAILASFVALDLASHVAAGQRNRPARYRWLIAGGIIMGSGLWCMHFIGMLAWRLPIPLAFDIYITALSLAVAIAASWIALHTAGRDTLRLPRLIAGGVLMGAGIVSMHYIGMSAMKMQPAIRYEPSLVVLSIAIAVAARRPTFRIAPRVADEGHW